MNAVNVGCEKCVYLFDRVRQVIKAMRCLYYSMITNFLLNTCDSYFLGYKLLFRIAETLNIDYKVHCDYATMHTCVRE